MYDLICAGDAVKMVKRIDFCDIEITEIKKRKSHKNDNQTINDDYLCELKRNFAWQYPFKTAAETHIKQSVTALTKAENDTKDEIVVYTHSKCDGDDRSGTEYGSFFHKQMQYRNLADENITTATKIIDEFLMGWTVYRELPFLSTIDTGDRTPILVQGIIDLLAVKGDRAIIIDYKTTKADEKQLCELYAPQLKLYADAVKKHFPKYEITAYIYSTRHKKLLAVPV
jgi:ATP-dependent exoDNAse (exonuclease V) beta subunit